MQDILTIILEFIVIYHLVILFFNFCFYVHTSITTQQNKVAHHFDSGIKAIMAVEPEELVTSEMTIIKATNLQQVTATHPQLNTLAQLRAYIKADAERRSRIEAFLNGTKYYRAKKGELLNAIAAVS